MKSSNRQTTLAALVVSGTALTVTTLLLFKKLKQKHRQWHSESEQSKRRLFRESVAKNADLVGPSPQLVTIAVTVADPEASLPLSSSSSVEKMPLEMLTSYDDRQQGEPTNYNNTTTTTTKPITAVFIHGFGCTSLEFQALAQQLQQQHPHLHLFRYDRVLFLNHAVLHQTGRFRDAHTLAHELHTLLQQAHYSANNNIEPPYLLIGHSYGGLVAQFFATSYPDEVAGMVLMDPAHERQFQTFPRDFSLQFTAVVPWILKLYEHMAWTGFFEWLDRHNLFHFPPLFLLDPKDPVRSALVQLYTDSDVWKTVAAELQGSSDTFDQLNQNDQDGNIGQRFRKELYGHNIPTGLVVAGHRQYSPTLFPKAVTRAFLDMHQDMPAKVFMAHRSDHWIHLQQPEVVVQAVDYVLKEISVHVGGR